MPATRSTPPAEPMPPTEPMPAVTVELTAWSPSVRADARALLVATADEFVPPLSVRTSAGQSGFTADDDDPTPSGLDAYLNSLTRQTLLCAVDADGRMAGFLSFRHAATPAVVRSFGPANYVTTLAVAHQMRRRGVAARLYDTLLHNLPPELQAPAALTRTWTTNTGHLRLLERLGFELVYRAENDRAAGIDTVFYRLG